MKKAILFTLILVSAIVMHAQEVRFTKSPSAVKQGDKVTLSFKVSGQTDIEAAVLDK